MTKDEKREVYVRYLLLKVEERDWHGVSDAANDLRELEMLPASECGTKLADMVCVMPAGHKGSHMDAITRCWNDVDSNAICPA